MKVGFIIGRFQTNRLHKGYQFVIKELLKECDYFAIILGTSPVPASRRNPFTYEDRVNILFNEFNRLDLAIGKFGGFIKAMDMKENEKWSKQIDDKIKEYCDGAFPGVEVEPILYCSRDSFVSFYSGTTKIVQLESPEPGVSSTKMRDELRSRKFTRDMYTDEYLIGKLSSIYSKFPTSYATVDIAILNEHGQILLGRKHAETKFRFPGGFVDVTDKSYEEAAQRESKEECGNLEFADFTYLGSVRIDDWRYKADVDKIMTTFFKCKYIFGAPKGSDDLAEVKWVNIEDVTEDSMVGEHWKMFSNYKNKLTY